MRELGMVALWALVPLLAFGRLSAYGQEVKRVRPPARAGQWYEATASALTRQVDGYLEKATPPAVSGRLVALIEPHAGYEYSGPTAAFGYKLLRGTSYGRVIILGVPHFVPVRGCALPNYTHFQTPLGEIPLDREVCDKLLASSPFVEFTRAHDPEHSVEAQLPFLQRTLTDFRIVPILVGDLSDADRTKAAEALRGFLDEKTLIVVSSDFTHYGADFGYVPFRTQVKENLDKLDHGAVKDILALDTHGFVDYVDRTGATICGRSGIALLLEMLKPLGDVTGTELAYTTSGDLTGDWSTSVSYCAIAFTRPVAGETKPAGKAGEPAAAKPAAMVTDGMPAPAVTPAAKPPLTGPAFLSKEEQQTCLRLARQSLEQYLQSHQVLKVDASGFSANLLGEHGCFVTLKKAGELRGCIGCIVGDTPLYATVIEYAVHAAVDDPRFPPVTLKELKDLDIEISVMTPLERVTDLKDIQVGRDGLLIKMGFNQGLLLPQVATEYGWDRDTFLAHTCLKAGLPPDAYKSPRAEILRFSAQVFGEKE
jgi:AmmeMemoRadiSam system protein B/AmmeMemoRadiSam system protein A